ncbi:MAG: spermidine/putrescine ABC transporter substrate-binding protein [Planctomycetes bacterium]|nr:spermidine/putrescine ABC transporter substrate-binding protein [Planctomycetota bacterium]
MKKFIVIPAVALLFLVVALIWRPWARAGEKPRELHLAIWANYLDPAVVAEFEKETGIKVVEENFDSNESLLAKIEAGAEGYDLIVPSDYTVQGMIRAGLLAELDLARIPNVKHLSPRFREIWYDPGNRHSVPYLWGTTGIGYDASKVDPPPASWGDLLEAARVEKYKGRVGMMDDAREAIGAALRLKGRSINSTDAGELAEAKALLIAQKPFVARYDSETYDDLMLSGALVMAQGWSGDFAKARAENANVRYVVPREGGVIWADNFAVVKTSKHKAEAEAFIDFVMRPEVNARIVNFLRYPSSNEAAKAFVKAEVLNDPGVYPPEDVMKRLEWIRQLGEASDLYDRVWTEVKNE